MKTMLYIAAVLTITNLSADEVLNNTNQVRWQNQEYQQELQQQQQQNLNYQQQNQENQQFDQQINDSDSLMVTPPPPIWNNDH